MVLKSTTYLFSKSTSYSLFSDRVFRHSGFRFNPSNFLPFAHWIRFKNTWRHFRNVAMDLVFEHVFFSKLYLFFFFLFFSFEAILFIHGAVCFPWYFCLCLQWGIFANSWEKSSCFCLHRRQLLGGFFMRKSLALCFVGGIQRKWRSRFPKSMLVNTSLTAVLNSKRPVSAATHLCCSCRAPKSRGMQT